MEIITSWENERIKYNKEKRLKKKYVEERVERYSKIKGRIVLVYKENRIEFKTKDIESRFSKIIDDLLRGQSQNSKLDRVCKEQNWNIERIKSQIEWEIEEYREKLKTGTEQE